MDSVKFWENTTTQYEVLDDKRVITPGRNFSGELIQLACTEDFQVWYKTKGTVFAGQYRPHNYVPTAYLLVYTYTHYYSLSKTYGPHATILKWIEPGGKWRGVKQALIEEMHRLQAAYQKPHGIDGLYKPMV